MVQARLYEIVVDGVPLTQRQQEVAWQRFQDSRSAARKGSEHAHAKMLLENATSLDHLLALCLFAHGDISCSESGTVVEELERMLCLKSDKNRRKLNNATLAECNDAISSLQVMCNRRAPGARIGSQDL